MNNPAPPQPSNPAPQFPGEGNTDVAALSAGIVAVAATLFINSGPYDSFYFVVGISVFLVILGYVAPHRRSIMRTVAFSATVSLSLAPSIGYINEILSSGENIIPNSYRELSKIISNDYESVIPYTEPGGSTPKSKVTSDFSALAWSACFIVSFIFDMIYQKFKFRRLA